MSEEFSFEVQIWDIEVRADRPRNPYRLRWTVAKKPAPSKSFATRTLADAFRSKLVTATRAGEPFHIESGLPRSMHRAQQDVTVLAHAREFVAREWPNAAAKSRVSLLETAARVLPVVTRDVPGRPAPDVLRAALRKDLNQGGHVAGLDADEKRALAWIEKASRPVSAFEDPSVVCDVLDALAVNLDGSASAPNYFARRRLVLHKMLGYAVRKKRLAANPVAKDNLPDGWTPPPPDEDSVDPRSVGSPGLIAGMLTACGYIGRRQGPRMVAFFACMYYAMMRPAEVSALTQPGCHLPESGWGSLTFADSTPAAGRAYTDDGQVHEHRGLKARHRGRSRDRRRVRPARRVPIPPELVVILREHIARFGTGKDGRLFRSEGTGQPLPPSTWSRAWKKVRDLSLTPEQRATPLLRRPYDLRHSGVTWRLNSGVPATQVAEWAGHSVEVLMRVYARCMTGMEDVWIARMDDSLHLEHRSGNGTPESPDNDNDPGGCDAGAGQSLPPDGGKEQDDTQL